jgi:hypothetical protein
MDDYGSLCLLSNQGTEASNIYHQIILDMFGRPGREGESRFHQLMLYMVRNLLYQHDKTCQEMEERVQNELQR